MCVGGGGVCVGGWRCVGVRKVGVGGFVHV